MFRFSFPPTIPLFTTIVILSLFISTHSAINAQDDYFKYGGHVTSTSSHRAINAMMDAEMSWMKIQVRYTPGIDTITVEQEINKAHANGFKILLGVVGNPEDMLPDRDDYIEEYAEFLGEIALLGPDAIEVWNEPNLDREWPTGEIDGANYTVMLREAYTAIKESNPDVMIISAAPAPTDAEAGYPGQVVDDDNFLRQMVNAGALDYMDCVGMHYYTGTVPPNDVSGDFWVNVLGDHYSYYLPAMIDVYHDTIDGQKPICVTEIGYLSQIGYPSLREWWDWSSGTTLEQHAQWLAEAMLFLRQSGQVRLMIIWNVDFTEYDDYSPMAGYAIIRADGSCPACDALAKANTSDVE
jgi:hypothetical protein